MSLDTMLNATGQLQRHVVAKDSSGGMVSASWGNRNLPFACDVQPASADNVLRYAQDQNEVIHTIFCSGDCGALTNDRVQVTDDSGLLRTFKVRGYQKPAIGYDDWPGQIHVVEDPEV